MRPFVVFDATCFLSKTSLIVGYVSIVSRWYHSVVSHWYHGAAKIRKNQQENEVYLRNINVLKSG